MLLKKSSIIAIGLFMEVSGRSNTIESVNMSLRRLTRQWAAFPTDEALIKLCCTSSSEMGRLR